MTAEHYPEIAPFSAGLRCRCPRCGRGRLFAGLLDVADKCDVCGLDLASHDSGDGPAVFVIFILGALIVPLALALEVVFAPPLWLHAVVWIPVVIGASIALLRPVKAILIAFHYRNLRDEYDP
jgi:uncharacterized protein (DUF983 family)